MSTTEDAVGLRAAIRANRSGGNPVAPRTVQWLNVVQGSTEQPALLWNVRNEAIWLASAFAVRARDFDFVRSVWQADESPRIVGFLDEDTSLDDKLALHTLFAELASGLDDPGIGDLVLRGPENEADTTLFVRRLHPT